MSLKIWISGRVGYLNATCSSSISPRTVVNVVPSSLLLSILGFLSRMPNIEVAESLALLRTDSLDKFSPRDSKEEILDGDSQQSSYTKENIHECPKLGIFFQLWRRLEENLDDGGEQEAEYGEDYSVKARSQNSEKQNWNLGLVQGGKPSNRNILPLLQCFGIWFCVFLLICNFGFIDVNQPWNRVSISDCSKTMSDNNSGPISHHLVECILHNSFRFCIQGTGSFVEEEDFRVL
nr:hypothetical protein Iba_chr14fCG5170 [Ipomoea batatas]